LRNIDVLNSSPLKVSDRQTAPNGLPLEPPQDVSGLINISATDEEDVEK